MSQVDSKSKAGRSTAVGKFTGVGKERAGKTAAGSALTQPTSKVSTRSGQVLKTVSSAHSEALKRLKDR